MSVLTTQLKTMLGTESTDGWITFMDMIALNMPFLFERGRPTTEQIANSEIGQAGYKSWKEYVVDALGWKVSAWEAWRRAYQIVQEHPFLKDVDPSVSAVNRVAADKGKEAFPASIEDWEKEQADVKQRAVESNAKSLSAANKMIESLRLTIEALERDDILKDERIDALEEEAIVLRKYKALPWYKKLFN